MFFLLLAFLSLGVVNISLADEHDAAKEVVEGPVSFRSGQLLPSAPGPDDPLSYDEIIWPWELGVGETAWGRARSAAQRRIKYWDRMQPSREARVVCTYYTKYGPQEHFSANHDKAVAIHLRTNDAAVLDNLKYFPELRELRILTEDSIGDALAAVRYCPHLTKVRIASSAHGSTTMPPPVNISKRSMKAIGSLSELRSLRLLHLDINDSEFQQLAEMKNLLFLDLEDAAVTSKAFQTIESWPRVRYLRLHGLDLDQELHEKTAKSIAALVGRIETLQTNEGSQDIEDRSMRIHDSLKPLFEKIRENGHLARRRVEPEDATIKE